MMFLCTVASELSNYVSCHSVHFLRINTVVILLGDVTNGNPCGWFKQKWRGVRSKDVLPEVREVQEFLT